MALLVLLNNFLHDFSAAGWLFCTLLLWKLLKEEIPADKSGDILRRHIKTIRWLMKLSLGGIVVFGLVRACTYKAYEWSEAAGDAQITLLIIKHIILAVVFYFGVVLFIRAGKLLKE
jgi:hypothetical protein